MVFTGSSILVASCSNVDITLQVAIGYIQVTGAGAVDKQDSLLNH